MAARYTNDELRRIAEQDNEEGRIALDLLEARGVELEEL